jgi:competence protein ComGC
MGWRSRRGFTVVELIAVVIVVIVLALALIPVLGHRSRTSQPPMQESTQIRGIHQGMVLWAQSNKDVYPLPSLVDVKDETVADVGGAKDTTANIMSMMIYNGFFSPELCVSPEEVNTSIKVMANYSYSNPAAAVKPLGALWDPAFSADFTGGKVGNMSFAHMLPAEERLKDWTNNFDASRAAVGSRGPQVASVAKGSGSLVAPKLVLPSNTLKDRTGSMVWTGNIAYNDNHVTMELSTAPTTYKDAAGAAWYDCLFFDEADDPSARNNYLGIFTTAGSKGAEFKAIWD